MKHKPQCEPLYSNMNNGSNCHIARNLGSFSKRCSVARHDDRLICATAATTQLNTSPALHLHEELPLAPFPSWKLYENPFFVDGKLVPKYISRYLNAPLDHAATSFTSSAFQGSNEDNALVVAVSNEKGSLNLFSAHKPTLPAQLPSDMAPARSLSRNVLNPAFWEHHELHRLSQSQEASIPSDLVNVQARAKPLCVTPSESMKCPSLHLDCETNTSGEERRVNPSKANMAACSIQATLASFLQRLRIVEDNQSRSNAAIAKLRVEMEDGSSRIQELEFSHESALREINSLLQRFGEQMTASRRKEQEKLRAAFVRLREEIEEERNTCRLLKLQNKKLMKELEEANLAAADAGEELDRERQARELMEEVCNELAREIGEDKAEVEQLKQEQAKSREMVEEEMKTIRMASLWRDERVKTKISEAQLELDDKHHLDVSLAELKSRVEEFVSTVSAASCEPYKAQNNVLKESKTEKQKKIIEQAKLLRQALELSMQQVADDGGTLRAQAHMDFEEKILTPIIQDQHTRTSVCDCCSEKVHQCENESMSYTGGHVELQVRPGNYMVNYSKKPCKDIRRPRTVLEDDPFDHNATIVPQARKPVLLQTDNDVEAEQEGGNYIQSPHQSPSPEHFLYESNKIWLATGGGGHEPGFHCSLSSNRAQLLKETVHQKQLSLHFEASQERRRENADVWEDDLTPNASRAQCYSEDDVSQVCMEDEVGIGRRQKSRRGRSAFRTRATKQGNGMHPWKSPDILEEHMRRENDGIDCHVECLMHQEYEGAKSLCADGAESGEEEHGEFDGFYFEPVMDDDMLEDDRRVHYRQENDHRCVADLDDGHGVTTSKAYDGSVQQSRSSKEATCKSQPHDGGIRTSARFSGTSANSSGREEAMPPPPPPHKLVLPTPSAIRVPLVKTHYTSPRSVARSLSPSKPQVLQCFRPPPTSPEHNSAIFTGPISTKGTAKGEGVETQQSGGGRSSSKASKVCTLLRASSNNSMMREEEAANLMNAELGEQGQGKEIACGTSRGAMEELKKGNSLRAELIKARELDLHPVNYNMNAKPGAPPSAPNKSSSSSSFRFSPLRRSLTSTSQAGR